MKIDMQKCKRLRAFLLSFSLVLSLMVCFFQFSSMAALAAAPRTPGPARAQWIDSAHITLKLPQGLSHRNGLHFYISGSTVSLLQLPPESIELPLVSSSAGYVTLSTGFLSDLQIDSFLRQSLKVYTLNANSQIIDSTAIQSAGILDELYFYGGNDLGIHFTNSEIGLKLWAPTAQQVRVYIYRSPSDETSYAILPMFREKGVWSAKLSMEYRNLYFLYEVRVYQPLNDKIETYLVTDPYSVGLSVNGAKTQLIDLNSPATKPIGWDSLRKPDLNSISDAVIYEMHLRDFTAADASLPLFHRGGYLAFSHPDSTSMQHLKQITDAGVTHVHMLPFNDFGSINEDKAAQQNYTGPSTDPEEPQNVINRIRDQDPYGWGYDPVHYFAPEGSYAVANDGEGRVRELRSMIQNLNHAGLRVVQDAVFNHTFHSGLDQYSIFDRIVPLYYYRLNGEGIVENSSCCSDTATEHRMMEKLMIDAVTSWAINFKVDGFRFDLMSFHTLDNMLKVRHNLRSLTPGKDGVDGAKLLIFGEGWSFGSLEYQRPSDAMTQLNSFGMGIGMFNDRLRDAVRGGTTNSEEKSDQGFATGLFFDYNKEPANRNTPGSLNGQRDKLLHLGDVIKAGLAGNLRDYSFREHFGTMITAGSLKFRSMQVATAAQAIETINYVSAHDGFSLWDAMQAKAPFYTPDRSPHLASIEDKRRMLQLSLAIVLLGQGIPFIDSGSEILRSKSGDQDSYDSGDFFNAIDWSFTTNNWAKGLPPAWKNYSDWSFWSPRMRDPAMKVTSADIRLNYKYFQALLRVRKGSPLFKLNSLSEISQRVKFIDNDIQAEPGLIAMNLVDGKNSLLIFFNTSRTSRTFYHPILKNKWVLHPQMDASVDPELETLSLTPERQSITLPGRSTVILVENPL